MEGEESYPDSDGEMTDEVDDTSHSKQSRKQNGSSSVGDDITMSGGSASGEAEDGEILEDGEIDDEVAESEAPPKKPEPEETPEDNNDEVQDSEKTNTQKEESESENEDELAKEKRKKEKKRKKQRKEKKRKGKEESKRKRKRYDYVDFDNIEEDFNHQSKTRRRSPSGPYDSPYQSQEERGNRSPPGPYESPYRSPPGPYDSPPNSPPGPYDSPPEDSEEEQRYGEPKTRRKRAKKSMMGLLEDPYLDPTIAVSEKQDIFQGAGRGRHQNRHRQKMDMPQQPRKKPLLATPRSDRPLCKFYKEGKCAKGSQCPFNHDFTPQKKPDICKFYLNSTCNKGNDCIYMHGEYPCKFFHTGAECYGGDNCKFSHDPLTAETYPLLNKILDNDDEFLDTSQKAPRPSLLGSPPRHVKEAAERLKGEQVKKIPSLLDIEVFPPNQSPQKQQTSPNKDIVSPKAGSMLGRPGFYNDTGTSHPTVVALEVLLNKAAANQSPRFYQPNNMGYPGGEDQPVNPLGPNQEEVESEVDNSQDTQKLDEEGSQDGLTLRGDEVTSDEERKQSSIEVPSHLPPKQRELFLRIQHQQQLEGEDGDSNAESPKQEEVVEPVDDDDWYSSDEEDAAGPKPKLMDFLKNISKQNSAPTKSLSEPPQEQPKLPDSGSAGGSSFNILQMLSAIAGQSSTNPTSSPAPVATSQLLDSLVPKKKETIKEIPLVNDSQTTLVENSPVRIDDEPDPMKNLPRVPKDGSDLPYTVLTITVNKSPYIPPNLNLTDPCVSNDPRVQRFLSKGIKLERQNSNSIKQELSTVQPTISPKTSDPRRSTSGTVEKNSSVKFSDPRKSRQPANSEGPSDPRRQKDGQSSNSSEDVIKPGDQRLQRAMTELIQSAVGVGNTDLRLQKSQSNPVMAMHNMSGPPMRPGFSMGFPRPPPGAPLRPMGLGPQRPPGMLRLPRNVRPPLLMTPVMPDNSFIPRGPRPFVDPRFARQNSNEMSYGPAANDPRNRGQGMSPHEQPSVFGPPSNDPRNRLGGAPLNQEPVLDPRMRQSKPQDAPNYPQISNDPRLKNTALDNVKKADPRLDRHGGSLDSSMVGRSSDPRISRQTSQPVLSSTEHSEGTDSAEENRLQTRIDPRVGRRQDNDHSNSGSPRIKKKKFIGERKGSMEYSSPLGLGSDQPDPALSGFSSYNRPPANRPLNNSKLKSDTTVDLISTENRLNTGYSRSPLHTGYESPQQQTEIEHTENVQFPAALQAPPLKELFKTIDPTASPFC